MTLMIDIKNSGVLTLLRNMEQLDLLRVITHETAVSPVHVVSAKSEERDRELFKLHTERLNAEALDVLSYQSLDL